MWVSSVLVCLVCRWLCCICFLMSLCEQFLLCLVVFCVVLSSMMGIFVLVVIQVMFVFIMLVLSMFILVQCCIGILVGCVVSLLVVFRLKKRVWIIVWVFGDSIVCMKQCVLVLRFVLRLVISFLYMYDRMLVVVGQLLQVFCCSMVLVVVNSCCMVGLVMLFLGILQFLMFYGCCVWVWFLFSSYVCVVLVFLFVLMIVLIMLSLSVLVVLMCLFFSSIGNVFCILIKCGRCCVLLLFGKRFSVIFGRLKCVWVLFVVMWQWQVSVIFNLLFSVELGSVVVMGLLQVFSLCSMWCSLYV